MERGATHYAWLYFELFIWNIEKIIQLEVLYIRTNYMINTLIIIINK